MNTASTILPEPSLRVSDAALTRLRELIREEGKPALRLRVSIEGGGCSGFQYGVRLDETRADDDLVIEREGVEVLVDPLSMQYLDGAEVDYVEQLSGAQFVIHNPNAKSTCGCGSSFTT
ncbi:MAG: iron-sulfur cluster insertion protein ErpA [Proteobacteria bacterium]|nr:iron-sulfur cluster insertion protein ErpA [Pseudomonadota bacterium]